MSAYRFWRFVCWLITKPLFRLTTDGQEHIPKTGPVVLVPNHGSFLDPPFSGICCPRPVRLTPVKPSGRSAPFRRQIGTAKGQFVVPDDFDDPLPDDILAAFEK